MQTYETTYRFEVPICQPCRIELERANRLQIAYPVAGGVAGLVLGAVVGGIVFPETSIVVGGLRLSLLGIVGFLLGTFLGAFIAFTKFPTYLGGYGGQYFGFENREFHRQFAELNPDLVRPVASGSVIGVDLVKRPATPAMTQAKAVVASAEVKKQSILSSQLGREPLPHEVILLDKKAVRRFAMEVHFDCSVIITNKRLIFWDRDSEKHSFEISVDDLYHATFQEKFGTDLVIRLSDSKKYEIGLDAGQREKLLDYIAAVLQNTEDHDRPSNVDKLVGDLKAQSLFRRQTAVEELGKLPVSDTQIVAALLTALESDNHELVRNAAASSLVAPANQAVIKQDRNLIIRVMATKHPQLEKLRNELSSMDFS